MSLYFYCIYSVGAVDCIDVLLRKGANPNKQDMLEVHALYHAARNGWVSNDFCVEPIFIPVYPIFKILSVLCARHTETSCPMQYYQLRWFVCVWGGGGGGEGGGENIWAMS